MIPSMRPQISACDPYHMRIRLPDTDNEYDEIEVGRLFFAIWETHKIEFQLKQVSAMHAEAIQEMRGNLTHVKQARFMHDFGADSSVIIERYYEQIRAIYQRLLHSTLHLQRTYKEFLLTFLKELKSYRTSVDEKSSQIGAILNQLQAAWMRCSADIQTQEETQTRRAGFYSLFLALKETGESMIKRDGCLRTCQACLYMIKEATHGNQIGFVKTNRCRGAVIQTVKKECVELWRGLFTLFGASNTNNAKVIGEYMHDRKARHMFGTSVPLKRALGDVDGSVDDRKDLALKTDLTGITDRKEKCRDTAETYPSVPSKHGAERKEKEPMKSKKIEYYYRKMRKYGLK